MSTNPANPAAPEPVRPEQGGDPSMEDILASIRRILNEEEPREAPSPDVLELTPAMRAQPPAATPAPAAPEPAAEPAPAPRLGSAPEPEPEPEPEAEGVAVLPPPEPSSQPSRGLLAPAAALPAVVHPPEPAPEPPTVIFTPVIAPAPAAAAPNDEPPAAPPQQRSPVPPRVEVNPVEPPAPLVAPAAAAAAAASMGELVRRLAGSQSVPVRSGGPTIEDIVREEIRGLLKAWLDENLPRVVERLVRAEIERVVSRHVG